MKRRVRTENDLETHESIQTNLGTVKPPALAVLEAAYYYIKRLYGAPPHADASDEPRQHRILHLRIPYTPIISLCGIKTLDEILVCSISLSINKLSAPPAVEQELIPIAIDA